MRRVSNFLLVFLGVATAASWVLDPSVAAAQSPEKLAERLTQMRAEVEALSAELTDIKSQTSLELHSLARRKADLELERERERVRIAKLRASLQNKRTTIQEQSSSATDLAPVYDRAREQLRAHVAASLPFRLTDRLAALDKIEEQRAAGILDHERALSRLWAFVEDELRMTRETGLFRQTIELGGQRLLADVVRLGMVMLLFRTEDGTLGQAQWSSQAWRFAEISDSSQKRRVRSLMDSFQKQIRVGLFAVPNALAAWRADQ